MFKKVFGSTLAILGAIAILLDISILGEHRFIPYAIFFVGMILIPEESLVKRKN